MVLKPDMTLPAMPVSIASINIILPQKNYTNVRNSFLRKQRSGISGVTSQTHSIFFRLEMLFNQGTGPQCYWILIYSTENSRNELGI